MNRDQAWLGYGASVGHCGWSAITSLRKLDRYSILAASSLGVGISLRVLPRAVIVPGNGCGDVFSANWYAHMKEQLDLSKCFSGVALRPMPDPVQAREAIWLPFIRDQLRAGPDTVLIGHSSGAEAGMRFLESSRLLGLVLVSACHTDLGDEGERRAGYYSRPWDWSSIRANVQWVLQYHSRDDPFIPVAEAEFVARSIGSEFSCFEDRSHFFRPADVDSIIQDLVSKGSAQNF